MFVLKSLFGRVWNDPNAAELTKISSGQLYLVRPDSIKGSRECLFNNAMATIRRTDTPFHFQLVITRVFEDGEEQLLDEDDETDDERSFLIDEALQFRTGSYEGEPTFIWRDLEGDESDLYEFVATGVNVATRAFFEASLLKAIYERKFQKSSEAAKDEDLQALFYKPPKKKATRSKAQRTGSGNSDAELAQLTKKMAVSSPSPTPQSAQSSTVDTRPVVISVEAQLFLFDTDAGGFVPQDGTEAKIVQNATFDFWIMVYDQGESVLAHKMTQDLNQRRVPSLLAFSWNHFSSSGVAQVWCLRFPDMDAYTRFGEAASKCLYEILNQQHWLKAKADEQSYVLSSHQEDVEMRDPEDDEEEVEDELLQGEDLSEEEEDEGAGYEDEDEDEETSGGGSGSQGKNSQLVVGYKNERSFVVRGNKIGVFKHTDDSKVEYAATLNKVMTAKGKAFTPKKVMLHDQDASLLLMNPNDPHAVHRMDIETGKVVEDWKVHDDVPVLHIAPDSKFAQMTPNQTLIGASRNGLFRIDPRLSGNKLVDSEFKQYVTKNAFSSVATTDAGKIAVASEKGDIRLYDRLGKNATTALPALGDPIIGVDVTANGRYIIATCKTYLLLIDTLIGDGRYKGSLGFDRSFPATSKPIPRRLQLRPEHVAYMGTEVSFTPARFNADPGKEENAIVTSTGNYVIAWDFAKVKAGRVDKYEIKKYDDTVVQDNFRFANDKDIVVALQNNVLMVNKKALKRPTRTSLSSPSKNLRSRSDIVNAPY